MTKEKTRLPEQPVNLKVVRQGSQGDLIAELTDSRQGHVKGRIFVIENRKIKPALAVGDEFVGKIGVRKGQYVVKPLARTAIAGVQAEKHYGVLENRDGKYYLVSAEKSQHMDYLVDRPGNAQSGDFVSFILEGERRYKQVRLIQNFGKFDLNKATAGLVLEKYDIPSVFDDKIGKELKKLPGFDKKMREDLTQLPLVTIDGEDSKDFDDAVFARETEGGFELVVAIADVSFYVRDGSELEREAYKRGNSVYLPNMVVPMLPEKLSNDLCSLRPNEERACVACLMKIDNDGNIEDYQFVRGVMKSAARLTYPEVQKALDGEKSVNIAPVYNKVIEPLYHVYKALARAREKRGALELETDEIKIKIGKNGEISSIAKEEIYTSNKIIEECMIAANVAAALALKKSRLPVMYRVHDKPKPEKLEDAKPLLEELHMKLPDAPALRPSHFNRLISLCAAKGYAQGIGDMILRMQSQAQYSPENIGHFGLGLKDYVHFTSPIRRYADLLIHRALIKAFKMQDGGGLDDTATVSQFEDIGAHISETERKAVNAERDLTARFVSAYLQPALGVDFEVKVVGIANAGMFVRIESLGAEGLIPLSSMPDDNYNLVNGNMRLEGEFSGLSFNFGDKIRARLVEASPISGGLIFKYLDPELEDKYYEKGGRGRMPFRKTAKPGKKETKPKGAKPKKKFGKPERKAQKAEKHRPAKKEK